MRHGSPAYICSPFLNAMCDQQDFLTNRRQSHRFVAALKQCDAQLILQFFDLGG